MIAMQNNPGSINLHSYTYLHAAGQLHMTLCEYIPSLHACKEGNSILWKKVKSDR